MVHLPDSISAHTHKSTLKQSLATDHQTFSEGCDNGHKGGSSDWNPKHLPTLVLPAKCWEKQIPMVYATKCNKMMNRPSAKKESHKSARRNDNNMWTSSYNTLTDNRADCWFVRMHWTNSWWLTVLRGIDGRKCPISPVTEWWGNSQIRKNPNTWSILYALKYFAICAHTHKNVSHKAMKCSIKITWNVFSLTYMITVKSSFTFWHLSVPSCSNPFFQ